MTDTSRNMIKFRQMTWYVHHDWDTWEGLRTGHIPVEEPFFLRLWQLVKLTNDVVLAISCFLLTRTREGHTDTTCRQNCFRQQTYVGQKDVLAFASKSKLQHPKKHYPGKRPQTVWGSGRIMYDNVDHDDGDFWWWWGRWWWWGW